MSKKKPKFYDVTESPKPRDGGPAFPFQATILDVKNGNSRAEFPGLSIRDYFAARALAGYLADETTCRGSRNAIGAWPVDEDEFTEAVCERCYQFADAMLKAREKQ